MLNQVVLVGRLVNTPIVENGINYEITLAVPRSFKNEEGMYDTDFIKCELWHMVAKNTAEYCKSGDLVGVKGRIQSDDNGMHIVAEKITFLSSRSNSYNEEGE